MHNTVNEQLLSIFPFLLLEQEISFLLFILKCFEKNLDYASEECRKDK